VYFFIHFFSEIALQLTFCGLAAVRDLEAKTVKPHRMYERKTTLQIKHDTPHCAKPLLAAALFFIN